MRTWLLILVGITLCGCASTAPVADRGNQAPAAEADQPVAAALVFAPTLGDTLPQGALARDGRGMGAYWGIQGPTTTLHYVRTDDRWGNDEFGHQREFYRRRAVEYRVGSSVRP